MDVASSHHVYVPWEEFWEVPEVMANRAVGLIYGQKKLFIYGLSNGGHVLKQR